MKARWMARFEVISHDPILIFDGAHNPQGINAAVAGIKSYFPGQSLVAISGVLRDKDYTAIANKIAEIASDAFTITPDNPRALSAEEYANELSKFGTNATATSGIDEAVGLAFSLAKQEKKAIVCLGSLYTYADVLKAVNKLKDGE